jgi:hypothetical protein
VLVLLERAVQVGLAMLFSLVRQGLLAGCRCTTVR